jgi:hypothetical protein
MSAAADTDLARTIGFSGVDLVIPIDLMLWLSIKGMDFFGEQLVFSTSHLIVRMLLLSSEGMQNPASHTD